MSGLVVERLTKNQMAEGAVRYVKGTTVWYHPHEPPVSPFIWGIGSELGLGRPDLITKIAVRATMLNRDA